MSSIPDIYQPPGIKASDWPTPNQQAPAATVPSSKWFAPTGQPVYGVPTTIPGGMGTGTGLPFNPTPAAGAAPGEIPLTQAEIDLGLKILRGELDLATLPAEFIPDLQDLADRVKAKFPNYADTATSAVTTTLQQMQPSGATPSPTGGGGTYGGVAGDTRPNLANASDAELDQYVTENYGYMAGYLSHPELGPILRQAAREGWDTNKLYGALSKTSYWKTTATTAREWDALVSTDPATANQKIDQTFTTFKTQAAALGIVISDDRLKVMATDSLRLAWTPGDTMRNMLREGSAQLATLHKGDFGAASNAVKALSANYMLPMSDQASAGFAQQLLTGDLTQDGLKAMLQEQAKGRFTGIANIIDAGISPKQFFDPYKQQIGQLLEVSPDSIDLLNDPRFSPVVETVQGDIRRPMTLSETQQYIRGLPDWRNTQQAGQQAASVAEFIAQKFGKVA